MSNKEILLTDLLDKKDIDGIKKIYNNAKKDDEFEIMFANYKKTTNIHNHFGLKKFLNLLGYIKNRRIVDKSIKIEQSVSMDISYSEKPYETYRLTINGSNNINKYTKNIYLRRNHVIFKVILSKFINKDKNIDFIKKVKKKENIYDVDELNIRVRLSKELDVPKSNIEELQNISEVARNKIIFRYKQRISMILVDNKDVTIRLDLTKIKSSNNINNLENSISTHEMELECIKKSNTQSSYLNTIYKETHKLLKIIQQSNYVITRSEQNNILSQYQLLLMIDDKMMHNLYGRKSKSLEIQHVIDILPNKYAVTDKADGERHFLVIFNKNVYLITYNLYVIKTGIVIPNSKYDNSVLDGELVFLKKNNTHAFLAFDCLFKGGEDIRIIPQFFKRLEHADDIIKACFVNKNHKGYDFKKYDGNYDINKLVEYHGKQIDKLIRNFNHDINLVKGFPLIRRKYFIEVSGGNDNEIFVFSKLMWNKYVYNKLPDILCPYTLDGLVYQPLNQAYVVSVSESKLLDYKWKPIDKNTMDFYITFERNKETNKILTVYDNSRDENIKWKHYRICYLHVGFRIKNEETPILFQRENNKHIAHLFLTDGEVRDIEGNIIMDKTVVEFSYNHDPEVPEEFRWVPIRTRFEKTESVILHKRKYGNYKNIADLIWRSIINPFTIKDINILANKGTYNSHMNHLRSKVDHSLIVSTMKENAYYQIKTTFAKSMTTFHNWIKSNLIYTYCNREYENDVGQVILDYGIGRGGDLLKYYYCKVDHVVGFDIDLNGIVSPIDGVLSRYRKFKKTKDRFPPMFFIHADGSALLDPDHQKNALGYTSKKNMDLINKFFSKDTRKKYDRIVCQMAFHYFLRDQTTWNNFCSNVNNYLKNDGFLVITTFDGNIVDSELEKNNGKYTSYYTNNKGEQKVLLDIKKQYSVKEKPIGLGATIDVHISLFSHEGVYNPEYIVDKNFLVPELKEKCGLVLIDDDTFMNQYKIHRENLTQIVQFESTPQTNKFLNRVSTYYNDNIINEACLKMTKLHKYYVFRKTAHNESQKGGRRHSSRKKHKKKSKSKDKQMVNITDDLDLDLGLKSSYIINNEVSGSKSFCTSLHHILQNDKIIPQNINIDEFYNSLELNLLKDNHLTSRKIKNINKRLTIEHMYNNEPKIILDGLNIVVIKQEEDDFNIKIYKRKKSQTNKSIILLQKENSYKPIYKKKENVITGVFNTTDKDIQHLLNL